MSGPVKISSISISKENLFFSESDVFTDQEKYQQPHADLNWRWHWAKWKHIVRVSKGRLARNAVVYSWRKVFSRHWMRNQGRPRYLWLATVTMHCEPAAKSSSLISGACCPAHGSGAIVTVIPEVRILPGILSLHKLDLSLKRSYRVLHMHPIAFSK